jgi:hypothetical protein
MNVGEAASEREGGRRSRRVKSTEEKDEEEGDGGAGEEKEAEGREGEVRSQLRESRLGGRGRRSAAGTR